MNTQTLKTGNKVKIIKKPAFSYLHTNDIYEVTVSEKGKVFWFRNIETGGETYETSHDLRYFEFELVN